jgi:predicted ATP-grasp superfamily ATP-dependent carboligase
VAERILVPHPLNDEQAFLAALASVVRRRRYEVLIPGSDASLSAISTARATFEPLTALGLPQHEVVVRCLDKLAVAEAADSSELSSPPTVVCSNLTEATEAVSTFGFPVILKPVSSVVSLDHGRRYFGSMCVENERVLVSAAPGFGERFLVQSCERAQVLSFAGVVARGELLGEVLSRYLRTWYPDAGNAALSETVEAPGELRRRVISLLEDLQWQGLFEIELLERSDGGWSAIDFNPRPHGSLALALGAGVNLPAIWCDHLLGRAPAPVRARPGVFYRWEDADLRWALWQARSGQVRAGARVLRTRRGVRHAYFELRDPGPLLARTLFLLRSAPRYLGELTPSPRQQQDVRDPAVHPSPRATH